MNVTIRPSSRSKKRLKIYFNVFLRHDKHFRYSLERFVNLLSLVIILICSNISNISWKLMLYWCTTFIKCCDALNFEFFYKKSFFKYVGYSEYYFKFCDTGGCSFDCGWLLFGEKDIQRIALDFLDSLILGINQSWYITSWYDTDEVFI